MHIYAPFRHFPSLCSQFFLFLVVTLEFKSLRFVYLNHRFQINQKKNLKKYGHFIWSQYFLASLYYIVTTFLFLIISSQSTFRLQFWVIIPYLFLTFLPISYVWRLLKNNIEHIFYKMYTTNRSISKQNSFSVAPSASNGLSPLLELLQCFSSLRTFQASFFYWRKHSLSPNLCSAFLVGKSISKNIFIFNWNIHSSCINISPIFFKRLRRLLISVIIVK